MFNAKIVSTLTEHQKTPLADLIARINDPAKIHAEHELILSQPHILELLNTSPLPAIILNQTRQVVAANESALKTLGVDSVEKLLGLRPGELMACVHGHENENGCGTTAACSMCGAVNAFLEAQHTGKQAQQEATLSAEINNQYVAFDFRVSASPIQILNKTFYIVYLQDISAEKTREMYSKVFFHDLGNIHNVTHGMYTLLGDQLEILKKQPNAEQDFTKAVQYQQIGQVKAQQAISLGNYFQQLVKAETQTLELTISKINLDQELLNFVQTYETLAKMDKLIEIKLVSAIEDLTIYSDHLLLRQILENIFKNAYEATPKSATVTIELTQKDETVIISIHNMSVIPENIQLQIFNRNVSTKGKGRGIGTYSMKLLAENYLQGKVWFTSTATEGTTFYVQLPKELKITS